MTDFSKNTILFDKASNPVPPDKSTQAKVFYDGKTLQKIDFAGKVTPLVPPQELKVAAVDVNTIEDATVYTLRIPSPNAKLAELEQSLINNVEAAKAEVADQVAVLATSLDASKNETSILIDNVHAAIATEVGDINKQMDLMAKFIAEKANYPDVKKIEQTLVKATDSLSSELDTKANKDAVALGLAGLQAKINAVPPPVKVEAGSDNVTVVKEDHTYIIHVDIPKVAKQVIHQGGGGVSEDRVEQLIDDALVGFTPGGSGTVTNITSIDGSIAVTPIAGGYDLAVISGGGGGTVSGKYVKTLNNISGAIDIFGLGGIVVTTSGSGIYIDGSAISVSGGGGGISGSYVTSVNGVSGAVTVIEADILRTEVASISAGLNSQITTVSNSLSGYTTLSVTAGLTAGLVTFSAATSANTLAQAKAYTDVASGALQTQITNIPLNIYSGGITIPAVTVTSGGLLNVASMVANINTSSDFTGTVSRYTIPALVNYPLVANTYYYVTAIYNGGSPIYDVITDNTIVNHSDRIQVANVIHEVLGGDNEPFIFYVGTYGTGLTNKLSHRLIHTQRFGWESGLALTETTGRIINIGAGMIWYDGEEISLAITNTTTTPYHLYYRNPANPLGWDLIKASAYNNTQWDNGSGTLQTLTNNNFSVNYVYRSVAQTNSDTFVVLGTADYAKLSDAIAAQPPVSLPPIISKQCILVGRIIVEKNLTTAASIDSAFVISFSSQGGINHNDTGNIQGGTALEYYHLTSAQHADYIGRAEVAGISGSIDSNVVHKSGNESISGIKIFKEMISSPKNSTGLYNEVYGMSACRSVLTADANTVVGSEAQFYTTSGHDNTSVGRRAGYNVATASYNTSIGAYANLIKGSNNTAIGYATMSNAVGSTTGTGNTAVGFKSLYSISTGNYNSSLGYGSLTGMMTGSYNIALGHNSGWAATTSNKFYVNSGTVIPTSSFDNYLYGDMVSDTLYIRGDQVQTASMIANISSALYSHSDAASANAYNQSVAYTNALVAATSGSAATAIQGRVACTSATTYTINHFTIDPLLSFPVVSLEVANSSSDIFVQAISNRTANSFDVTLTGTPDSTVAILYHLTSSSAISLDLSPYTLMTTTAALTGNLQGQINAIVQEGTSISSSAGTILVNQTGLSFELEVADYISKTEVASISSNFISFSAATSANILAQAIAYDIVQDAAMSASIVALIPNVSGYALNSDVVHLTGNESISGNKKFAFGNTITFAGAGFGAPFAVSASSSGTVANFSADKLDGQHGSYYTAYTDAASAALYTLIQNTSGGSVASSGSYDALSKSVYADVTVSTSGTYTISPSSAGRYVYLSYAGAMTAQLPDISAMPNGSKIAVYNVTTAVSGANTMYVHSVTSSNNILGTTGLKQKITLLSGNYVVLEANTANSTWYIRESHFNTDWINSGLMVCRAVTTNPVKSVNKTTDSTMWRRDGNEMCIRYNYGQTTTTGASAGSGTYIWNIPGGQSIDTATVKVAGTYAPGTYVATAHQVGSGNLCTYSGSTPTYLIVCPATATEFIAMWVTGATQNYVSSATYGFTVYANAGWFLDIKVPIKDW